MWVFPRVPLPRVHVLQSYSSPHKKWKLIYCTSKTYAKVSPTESIVSHRNQNGYLTPNIRGRRKQVLVLGIFTCTRCFRLETGALACPRVMRATSESRLNDHGRGAIGPLYPDDPGGETYRVSARRSRRDAP